MAPVAGNASRRISSRGPSSGAVVRSSSRGGGSFRCSSYVADQESPIDLKAASGALLRGSARELMSGCGSGDASTRSSSRGPSSRCGRAAAECMAEKAGRGLPLVTPKSKASAGNLRVCRGQPLPHGCSQGAGDAVNFSVMAADAQAVWLVLEMPGKQPGGEKFVKLPGSSASTGRLIPLSPKTNRTGSVWHIQVLGSSSLAGRRYGWVVDQGEACEETFQPHLAAVALDPCARVVDSATGVDSFNQRDKDCPYSPVAIVPDFQKLQAFDWDGVGPPGHSLRDLIIYEAHVRSFTRNEDSGLGSKAGGFLGFVEKIPHLKRLGINCVELMPISEFDETACPLRHPQTGKYLCQYWGYQTACWTVPMQRFASQGSSFPEAAIMEFKTLVRELHRAGIEVLLDVVFNHTGEGAWGESNWHCLSKVAVGHFYLLSEGHHTNYTGCGNTVNANDPVCCEWIHDCLRYWVQEMRVDGFRFDLAAALCRGPDGKVMEDPPLFRRLAADPCMQHVKLIAEPWDCDWPWGYLLGKFPTYAGRGYAEWNGKFRDAARRFIKGDPGMRGEFATRLCGSSDLYEPSGRGPCHSINFITAHDGFTLRDLVSYNGKNNFANSEESGEDTNNSWNCGKDSGDDGRKGDDTIDKLREKQMRNLMLALMLSAGTPMFPSGDEYGRSQGGNNNPWCQDELNWFSWADCAQQKDGFLRFVRLLISLRKQHSDFLARSDFLSSETITWNFSDWDNEYNFLSFILHRHAEELLPEAETGTMLMVTFNSGAESYACNVPPGHEWHRIVDTNLASPHDFADSDADAVIIHGGDVYTLAPYSCIVLRSFKEPSDALTYEKLFKPQASSGKAELVEEDDKLFFVLAGVKMEVDPHDITTQVDAGFEEQGTVHVVLDGQVFAAKDRRPRPQPKAVGELMMDLEELESECELAQEAARRAKDAQHALAVAWAAAEAAREAAGARLGPEGEQCMGA